LKECLEEANRLF